MTVTGQQYIIVLKDPHHNNFQHKSLTVAIILRIQALTLTQQITKSKQCSCKSIIKSVSHKNTDKQKQMPLKLMFERLDTFMIYTRMKEGRPRDRDIKDLDQGAH